MRENASSVNVAKARKQEELYQQTLNGRTLPEGYR